MFGIAWQPVIQAVNVARAIPTFGLVNAFLYFSIEAGFFSLILFYVFGVFDAVRVV